MSRRPASWLVACVLLAVAVGMGWAANQRGDVAPRMVHGGLGDVVQVGEVYVAVESVRQADVVVAPSTWGEPSTYETAGTWLVVRLAYSGAGEPGTYGRVEWRDAAGRTFATDPRPLGGGDAAQPGQWLVNDVVLEVAPGDTPGGEVLLGPLTAVTGVPYRQGVIAVPAGEVERVAQVELVWSAWVENAEGSDA